MQTRWKWVGVLLYASVAQGAPKDVSFSQSGQTVEPYDFVEVTLRVEQPDARNPFTDVAIEGEFRKPGGAPVSVEGFCDSADGTIYRIRFMPSSSGEYSYAVTYRQGDFDKTHTGAFRAVDGNRRHRMLSTT